MGVFLSILQLLKIPPLTLQGWKDYMTLILVFSDHLSNKIYTMDSRSSVVPWKKKDLHHSNIFEVPNYILHSLSALGRLEWPWQTQCLPLHNAQLWNVICCDWKGSYESIKKRQNTLIFKKKKNDFQGKGWNLSEKRHLKKSLLRNESERERERERVCVCMCMNISSTVPLVAQKHLRCGCINK